MDKTKNFFLEIGIIAVITISAVLITRFIATAGNLIPPGPPASTHKTFAEIYGPLAGNFDSSSVTASSTGNALQIARCLIVKMDGGTCN